MAKVRHEQALATAGVGLKPYDMLSKFACTLTNKGAINAVPIKRWPPPPRALLPSMHKILICPSLPMQADTGQDEV